MRWEVALALTTATFVLYLSSMGAGVWFLLTPKAHESRWPQFLMTIGVCAQVLLWCALFGARGGHGLASASGGLLAISPLLVLIYLILSRRYARMQVIGLIVAAAMAAIVGFAGWGSGGHTEASGSRLHMLHAVVAMLASTSLTMAGALAVCLVAVDHQLKHKRLWSFFRRMPSLDVLEKLHFRSIMVGFVFLTVSWVLGAAWWHGDRLHFSWRYMSSAMAWLLYAGLLQAHWTTGFRGGRAAVVGLIAYLGVVLTVADYLIRGKA